MPEITEETDIVFSKEEKVAATIKKERDLVFDKLAADIEFIREERVVAKVKEKKETVSTDIVF